MRGCCDVSCSDGEQICKAGCEGTVSLNYRTSIAHHCPLILYLHLAEVLYHRFTTLLRAPKGVSNEHSCSDRIF